MFIVVFGNDSDLVVSLGKEGFPVGERVELFFRETVDVGDAVFGLEGRHCQSPGGVLADEDWGDVSWSGGGSVRVKTDRDTGHRERRPCCRRHRRRRPRREDSVRIGNGNGKRESASAYLNGHTRRQVRIRA